MTKPQLPTLALAAAALAAAALVPAGSAAARGASLSDVRDATSKFHRVAAAKADGRDVLKDAAGIACIDNPGVGGMGIHYVKGAIVEDGKINARTPEAVIYEPRANGKLRLVAVEYVVFQDAWDKAHEQPPSLFGQTFTLTKAGNRYGLPAFYELHAWIWRHNSRGMFDDWNPKVSCP
jgi:hypothetical protein